MRGPAVAASIATGLIVHLGLEALSRQTLLPVLQPPLAAGVLPAAVALAASTLVLIGATYLLSQRDRKNVVP